MGHSVVAITMLLLVCGYGVWTLRRQERTPGTWLLVCALVTSALLELADTALLGQGAATLVWQRRVLAIEAALPALWLLCSVSYARAGGWRSIKPLQWLLVGSATLFFLPVVFSPLSAFFYAPDFPQEPMLFLGTVGFYFYLGIMLFLVLALINLESTLTNTSPSEFWHVKFDLLGIGTIVAVQFLYFSQALLYRSLNMAFVPVREMLFMVGLLLLSYARLRQKGRVRIHVSRGIAYKSLVLLAVGGYLLLIGLIGEGMRYFGASLQHGAVIMLIVLSGIALLVVMLSGRVRRQVKVFLHKNFYENKYDYRTQWLQFTEHLAVRQSGADLQQVILTAYCETFGVRGAALFLLDQERRVFVNTAVYELAPIATVFSKDARLVRYLEERRWVFNSLDENPELLAESGDFLHSHRVSFIVPLATQETLEGFIVLGGMIHTNETYMYEDFDLMKTIARQASFAILNQRLAEQLTRMRETEAIGNIATFVIHDLKNHVAALSLTVDNARHYIDNPEFQQDMLHSLNNTVGQMQGLIARLKNLGEKELLHLRPVALLELATRTVAIVSGAAVQISGGPAEALGDGEELQKVLLNLLINAIEASSPQTPVLLEVGAVPVPHVRVTDHGCGMSLEFRQRELFKPFVTTKKKGLGIGLYQCRQIVEAHGGRIEVQSEEGKGSTFTVWLPGGDAGK